MGPVLYPELPHLRTITQSRDLSASPPSLVTKTLELFDESIKDKLSPSASSHLAFLSRPPLVYTALTEAALRAFARLTPTKYQALAVCRFALSFSRVNLEPSSLAVYQVSFHSHRSSMYTLCIINNQSTPFLM